MASAITHAIVGLALAAAHPASRARPRLYVVSAVCAALPDVDAIGFALGVPYPSLLGHRGLTHALSFAVVVAVVAVALAFRDAAFGSRSWWSLCGLLFLSTASHGALDALTNGGLGVGYAYEQVGQLDQARKLYLELLQAYPTSRYVPFAYLAFGEMFLQEAESDPSRWRLVQQSFEEVLKYPPPGNVVYGYALLRLGQVHARLDQAEQARARFAELQDLVVRTQGWAPAAVAAQLAPPPP